MLRRFPEHLKTRWDDPKGLIQIFIGPRQVGKTTAAIELLNPDITIFFTADAPAPPSVSVIEEKWNLARKTPSPERTLVLDEVQKIPGWSEVVKRLWDEDQRKKIRLRVALLGSSALLIEKGLSESLTGRFEINYFPHWMFSEIKNLSGCSLEEYAYFGGYPKVYDFKDDPLRAEEYIAGSIVEPTLGRDILALHSVDKPALLRQLFWYVSKLPAQIVSFEKILGSLQERGNSSTLVHYAHLLSLAFLVVPIFKYTKAPHTSKRSLPKWILPNSALIDFTLKEQGLTGFLFENLVGAHFLNLLYSQKRYELMYWRERNKEIDYILCERNTPILAIEVKSGRKKKVYGEKLLRSIGIDCPFMLIDRDRENFFSTASIQEVLAMLE